MARLYDALTMFLEEDDWAYTPIEGHTALRMGFAGENGRWVCFARSKEAEHQLLFYSVCPVNAPDAKRGIVAEFITRANYGLAIGNFEMDYEDGEIRFKTSLAVGASEFDEELIRRLVFVNVYTMDQYLPGIMSVIYGDIEPALAVARVEVPVISEPGMAS